MSLRRYAPVYDPASNAKGFDSSPRNNSAPQGVRVKSKAQKRRTEKKITRQLAKRSISQEISLA